MTPEQEAARIEAAAKALADPPDRKIDWQPHYEDFSEEHKETLWRSQARDALDAAHRAVPMMTAAEWWEWFGEQVGEAKRVAEADDDIWTPGPPEPISPDEPIVHGPRWRKERDEAIERAERAEAAARDLRTAVAFLRSCILSGEQGADHPVVLRALNHPAYTEDK